MIRLHQLHLAAVCLTVLVGASSGSGDWDYNQYGPSHWAELFPQFCAGEKQSPIDLSTWKSQQEPLLRKLVFSQSIIAAQLTLTLKNDGHNIKLNWSPELLIKMGISTDNLMYTAAQLHWHWGSDNLKGSEHTLDKRTYSAEGHLVFYNSRDFASMTEAADKPNGLAVLAIFYELSQHDNPLFGLMDRALANDSLVLAPGNAQLTVSPAEFDIFSLLLPKDTSEYFRYDGSLTTPNCYESVLWTVYRQPVPISQRQLDLLRRLKFSDNSSMTNNFRPPLPLNPGNRAGTPRTVYRTFSSAGSMPRLTLASLTTVAMLARLAAAVSA